MRLLLACLLLAALPAAAQSNRANVLYRAAAPEMPEPAPGAVWAKPLASGTLRVLFIAPYETLGDVQRLEERLDADIDTVGLWSSEHLGYDPDFPPADGAGRSAEAVRQKLLDRIAARHDVVILGNFDTALLPDAVQEALIAKVYNGAGLVGAHLDIPAGAALDRFFSTFDPADGAEEAMWRGVPRFPRAELHRMIPLALEPVRAVVFQWAGDRPRRHAVLPLPPGPAELYPTFKDDALALVLRAVLWTANRTPDTRIVRIEDGAPAGPDAEEIPPDLLPEFVEAMQETATPQPVRPFRVHFDQPTEDRYELRVQLRRLTDAMPFHDTTVNLPRGIGQVDVDLLIGQGAYLVDAWLRNRRGVVDWYTEEVRLDGWPSFENLQYEKNYLLPNDSLELAVRVPPVISRHRSGTLYARALDNAGRLVAESAQGFSHEGGNLKIRLHFADLVAPMVKVELYTLEGEPRNLAPWERNIADREHLYFPVRLPKPPRLPQLVLRAPAPGEPGSEALLARLARLGATTVYLPGDETALLEAAYSGLALLPELARHAAERADNQFARNPCLSSTDFLRSESMAVQKAALLHWAGAANAYSLGNPNYLCASDEPVCQHAACLSGFRKILQLDYGSLEALNRHWNSPFTQWEDIIPLARSDAQTLENFPPAVDFWEYMDGVFAAFHGQMAESVRTADPDGEIGFRALTDRHANNGYDWAELLRQVDFVAADPDPVVVNKLRSYGRPNRFGGVSVGDTVPVSNGHEGHWFPWHTVLHSLPALWYQAPFGEAAVPASSPIIAHDGKPTARGTALLEAFTTIDAGPGALLLAAQPGGESIAILESRASRRITELEPAFSQSSLDSEAAFCKMLDSLGYTYRFIDEQALRAGVPEGLRVLVLPSVQALDEATFAAIEAFADQGGAVIADTVPGTHDRHGLRHGLPLGAALFDRVVEAEDAAPEDGTEDEAPSVPLQPATAGPRNLLLDRVIPPAQAANHPARNTVHAFLRNQGVHPPAELDFGGEPLQGKLFTFDYGAGGVLAFLGDPDMDGRRQDIRFSLPRHGHVYDPLTGEEHTRPQRMRVNMLPGAAHLFTVLPYRVRGIELAAAQDALQGQRLQFGFRLDAGGEDAPAGPHLFQIDLVAPWGQVLRHYRQIIETQGGGGGYMPLALNEAPGTYRLRVRDTLTGITAEQRIEVQHASR